MSETSKQNYEYKYGFETEIENDSIPKGLNENIIHIR